MSFIYLDYNATTPVREEVVASMTEALVKGFGNPSSPHQRGATAKAMVDRARHQVASLIDCSSDEIVFTSGGSESNNHAIKGLAQVNKGGHIITSSIEHPAVENVCRFLEGEGFSVTYLPVDAAGRVDPAELECRLQEHTMLITIMHANNETGTIEPIAEISRIARKKGILFHTDAAQSLGKIPVHVHELGVDLLSIAGHKLYAPKGVGALFVRSGVALCPLVHGAGHESGRRAGTENVPGIVALGTACEIARQELEKNSAHLKAMRDRLHAAIRAEVPGARLNGHETWRLPNTLSLSFPGLNAPQLIDSLEDLAVSAGSACHAKGVEPSKVLIAMGKPLAEALGTIRFSTGHYTTEEEVDRAARQVIDAVKRLTS
jgi:cysteine desulfurase